METAEHFKCPRLDELLPHLTVQKLPMFQAWTTTKNSQIIHCVISCQDLLAWSNGEIHHHHHVVSAVNKHQKNTSVTGQRAHTWPRLQNMTADNLHRLLSMGCKKTEIFRTWDKGPGVFTFLRHTQVRMKAESGIYTTSFSCIQVWGHKDAAHLSLVTSWVFFFFYSDPQLRFDQHRYSCTTCAETRKNPVLFP